MKGIKLQLHENIQFIYELVMAERELVAAGVKAALLSDRRTFDVREPANREFLIRRSAYFERVDGQKTHYAEIQAKNQTGSVNQYLTHWFYPYKGKFHPQVIRALLNILGLEPNDVVLDPFVGSGTAAVEAQLLGIKCIGYDISPLCCLMSRVKTQAWRYLSDIQAVEDRVRPALTERARDIDQAHGQERRGIDYKELRLPDSVSGMVAGELRDFVELAWLVALSDFARRKKEFESSLTRNWERMVNSVRDHADIREELGLAYVEPDIRKVDARKLPLSDESIDGIVTSPPYSIALNYLKNDRHALEAMTGMKLQALETSFVGVEGTGEQKFRLYYQAMEASIAEMRRVLKPGAQCAIIIGNAKRDGKEEPTSQRIQEMCEAEGLRLTEVIPKIIHGLYNIIKKEYVLVFSKE